jgi:hypothetical protein
MKELSIVLEGVKKVSVLRRNIGTDLIYIRLSDKRAFPDCAFETVVQIDCQKGKGVDYCRDVLKVEPEIIDGSNTP